jgi:hypothetical protein
MNENVPPTSETPKGRSCLFYGCLTLLILALLVPVGSYFAIRSAVKSFIGKYADTKPMTLPRVEMSAAELDALDARLKAFRSAISTNGAVQPLTLSATDINGLINRNPGFKDKFYLGIESNQFRAKVSIPLEDLRVPFFRNLLQGRYINGTADLKALIQNGGLVVTLRSVEVNGRSLPAQMLAGFQSQNLVEGLTNDPAFTAAMGNLSGIEVTNGVVTVLPRLKASP